MSLKCIILKCLLQLATQGPIKNMLTKIVILAYLVVVTKQEPSLVAAPFVANYASSYDAHAINHDIRVPVAQFAPLVKAAPVVAPFVNAAPAVQAITAYSPAIAPLTSTIPQVVSPYSPVIASYSLAPVAAAPIASQVPLASAITPVVSAVTNSIQAAPAQARSNPDSAPIEAEEQNKPSRSTLSPENSVNPAILLASQFLARSIASPQNRAAASNSAPQADNLQETQEVQSRASTLPRDQGDFAILGATGRGFGLIQRSNARFAQIPLQQNNNQIQGADLEIGQPLAAQQNSPSAKLIRENEDSESVEVSSANGQAYEPEKTAVKGPVVPARLAALTPSVGIVPNVYTSYIAF